MSTTSEPLPAGEAQPEAKVLPSAGDAGVATTSRSVAAPSLEVDSSERGDSVDDNDSAIGSWRSTRTQSLTSSAVDHKYEKGRRYHVFREGEYHLPNDENEQDRLDMQHAIYRYALDDRLFLAPIPKDQLRNVLDVGCGTGLWAMGVADSNPQAQVFGFDLSPVHLQPDMVPPNARFLIDDCNAEWGFAERPFDLIHTRALTPGIKDWSRSLHQAKDHLTPGEWVELHEIHVPAGCTESSLSPSKPYFWQNWPVEPWARGAKNKRIGRLWAEDMKHVTRNTAAMFTRVLGWSAEEFEVFAARIAEEIDAGEKHMWVEM
ncbi:Uu.00g013720.m01.CDS01 [Anthostomella pinea]|uniref:Uu.00g013720.m01.CDS01 n=1 Tax=Anthostomella pinea TaxID=933095 RepID=A0AAI8VY67_9PEZI|nr:Uu.00g013720.m01.CDS01 [Anthostomella pinea]